MFPLTRQHWQAGSEAQKHHGEAEKRMGELLSQGPWGRGPAEGTVLSEPLLFHPQEVGLVALTLPPLLSMGLSWARAVLAGPARSAAGQGHSQLCRQPFLPEAFPLLGSDLPVALA